MKKYPVVIQYPNGFLEKIEVQVESPSAAVSVAVVFAKKNGATAFFPLEDYIALCKESREMGKVEEREKLRAWAKECAYTKIGEYIQSL